MNNQIKSLWVGLGVAITVLLIIFTWMAMAKLGVIGLESMFGTIAPVGKHILGFFIFLLSAFCTIVGAIGYMEYITPDPPPLTEEERRKRDLDIEAEDAARYGY